VEIKATGLKSSTFLLPELVPGDKKEVARSDEFIKSEPGAEKAASMKNVIASIASTVLNGPNVKKNGGMASLQTMLDVSRLQLKARGTSYNPDNRTIHTNLQGNKGSFLAAFSEDGALKWCTPAKPTQSDIVFDRQGNMAYRNADEVVFCDNQGQEKWSFSTENQFFKPLACSNPAIGPDGTVYFAKEIHRTEYCRRYNEPDMQVVAVKDGKEKWKYGFRGNQNSRRDLIMTGNGIILVNNKIYKKGFFSEKNLNCLMGLSPDGQEAFCTRAGTSEIEDKVSFFEEYRPNFTEGPGGSIYFVHNQNSLSVFTPTGKKMETVKLTPPPLNNGEPMRMMIAGRPVLDKAGNIYLRGKGRYRDGSTIIYCLDRGLNMKWRSKLGPHGQQPWVDESKGIVFVGVEGNKSIALDKHTGNLVGALEADNEQCGEIAIGRDASILVNTSSGTFHIDGKHARKALAQQALAEEQRQAAEGPDGPAIEETDDFVVIDGVKLDKKKYQLLSGASLAV